jgi:hypothetical protein
MADSKSKRRKAASGKGDKRSKWIILAIATVAVIGGAIYFYRIPSPPPPPPPVVQRDPLCEFVGSKQLRCVAFLGADSLLGPGAIVDYAANSPRDTPVPLPVAAIFSTSCLVPGAEGDALKAATKVQNPVAVPNLTYNFDRSLAIGTSLNIPKIAGLDLKAGPQMGQLRDVTLKVPTAWVQMMDENLFLDALENAGIKSSCVDRLLAQSYQIVSNALVGRGLDYSLTDKSNQTFSAKLAAEKGLISLGADAGMNEKMASVLASQDPLVMGVTFLKLDSLKHRAKLKEPVVWSATGETRLSATGGGGERHISEQKSAAGFQEPARIRADGSEQSECNAASNEVTRSMVAAEARVVSSDGRTLEFVPNIQARGGHYATAGRCVAGVPLGITGHDTSATVNVAASGTIRATVKLEMPHWLTVEGQDLPDQSTVSVQGPDGRLLLAENQKAATATVPNGQPVRFRLPGAGVYIVNTLINLQVVGQGAKTNTYQRRGTLKASTESIRPST